MLSSCKNSWWMLLPVKLCYYKTTLQEGRGKCNLVPRALFPGFGGETPTPRKSALGTRLGKVVFQLAMVSNFVGTSAKNRYFPLTVMSYKVLSDVLAVTTEQHYCFAVSSTWSMFFYCDASSPNNPLPFYDICTSFKEPTCKVKRHSKIQFLWWCGRKRNLPSESSEIFPSSTNRWRPTLGPKVALSHLKSL